MSIIRIGLVLLFLVFSSYTSGAATSCFLLWCYKTKIYHHPHPHPHPSHTHTSYTQSNHKKYFKQPEEPEEPINDKFCQEVQDNFNNLTPKELGTYVEKLISSQRYEAKKCLEQ